MAAVVLVLLVGSAAVTVHWRRSAAACLLVMAALVWPTVRHGLKGPVLMRLTHGHGVHVSDLLSLGALALAGWLFLARQDR